jgi:hypothetical protein
MKMGREEGCLKVFLSFQIGRKMREIEIERERGEM